MARYIQSDERTKATPKNTLPNKAIIRFERGIKNFTDEQKLRVQYHQTSFTGNVKGTSPIKKEKTMTRNMKITKGKISLIKANIQ